MVAKNTGTQAAPAVEGTKKRGAAAGTSKRAGRLTAKMNKRLLATGEWAQANSAMFSFVASQAPMASAIHRYATEMAIALRKVHIECSDVGSKALLELTKAGWVPVKAPPFTAGAIVRFRKKRLDRVIADGAYTATELAELAVVSVHGRKAKLKTGANVGIGVYPMSWLESAKPATAAAAA